MESHAAHYERQCQDAEKKKENKKADTVEELQMAQLQLQLHTEPKQGVTVPDAAVEAEEEDRKADMDGAAALRILHQTWTQGSQLPRASAAWHT